MNSVYWYPKINYIDITCRAAVLDAGTRNGSAPEHRTNRESMSRIRTGNEHVTSKLGRGWKPGIAQPARKLT